MIVSAGMALAISSPLIFIHPETERVMASERSQPGLAVAQLIGRDYLQLRDLLAAQQWLAADEATDRLMLKIAGREPEGSLTQQDIKQFPCKDLRTINQLWVRYSKGRFGFTPQNKIWNRVRGLDKNDPNLTRYGDLEKLRNFKALVEWDKVWRGTDPRTAPAGHLPKVLIDVDVPGPEQKWPLAYEPSTRRCLE